MKRERKTNFSQSVCNSFAMAGFKFRSKNKVTLVYIATKERNWM